jgi:hypothetical protein
MDKNKFDKAVLLAAATFPNQVADVLAAVGTLAAAIASSNICDETESMGVARGVIKQSTTMRGKLNASTPAPVSTPANAAVRAKLANGGYSNKPAPKAPKAVKPVAAPVTNTGFSAEQMATMQALIGGAIAAALAPANAEK